MRTCHYYDSTHTTLYIGADEVEESTGKQHRTKVVEKSKVR
jgi:hypothetical protein